MADSKPVSRATDEDRRLYSNGIVGMIGDRIAEVEYVRTNIAMHGKLLRRNSRPLSATPGGMFAPPGLGPDQTEAFKGIASGYGVMALTGGPGTGKTTMVRSLIAANSGRARIVVSASTHKACDQLRQGGIRLVHTAASVAYNGCGGYDLLIVDEASMLDVDTLDKLLDAGTGNVLLVGDVNQLPPVGSGHPFFDLIDSGIAKTFRLKTSRRNNDAVAEISSRILSGTVKYSDIDKRSCSLEDGVANSDIVLTYKNATIDEINQRYPSNRWVVLETKGEYFNSQIIEGDEPSGVEHKMATAITVHRSQGSEWDRVHIHLDARMSMEMLYTAVTRAKHGVTFSGKLGFATGNKSERDGTVLRAIINGNKLIVRESDVRDV